MLPRIKSRVSSNKEHEPFPGPRKHGRGDLGAISIILRIYSRSYCLEITPWTYLEGTEDLASTGCMHGKCLNLHLISPAHAQKTFE